MTEIIYHPHFPPTPMFSTLMKHSFLDKFKIFVLIFLFIAQRMNLKSYVK